MKELIMEHVAKEQAAMGGAQYVDVIAAHYNEGKDADHGKIDDFEYQVSRLRELLGTTKPVWVTEFGTLVGNNGGQLMGLPEGEAGAWFVRFYAAGLAAGVNRFYPDATAFVTFPSGTIVCQSDCAVSASVNQTIFRFGASFVVCSTIVSPMFPSG